MSMSKKDLIALADLIVNQQHTDAHFNSAQIEVLADLCQSQNPRFNRERWLDYINGENGSRGGKVKGKK